MELLLYDAAAADSSAVLVVSSSSYTPTVVAGLEDDVDAGVVGRVARPGANTARGMTKEWAVEEEEEATEKTRTKTDAAAAAGWRRLNWRRNVVVIVRKNIFGVDYATRVKPYNPLFRMVATILSYIIVHVPAYLGEGGSPIFSDVFA